MEIQVGEKLIKISKDQAEKLRAIAEETQLTLTDTVGAMLELGLVRNDTPRLPEPPAALKVVKDIPKDVLTVKVTPSGTIEDADFEEVLLRWWQFHGEGDPQTLIGVRGRAQAIGMTLATKLRFGMRTMLDHGIL